MRMSSSQEYPLKIKLSFLVVAYPPCKVGFLGGTHLHPVEVRFTFILFYQSSSNAPKGIY